MKKPWEETWRLEVCGGPDLLHTNELHDGHSYECWMPSAVGHMAAASPELYRALEAAQWSAGETGGECPACDGYRPSPDEPSRRGAKTSGHRDGCKLNAALKKARGES